MTRARKSSPAAAPSGSSGNSPLLPGGAACRLTGGRRARLPAALDQGPAACRWSQEQRRTLARVTTLIGRLFHLR